MYKTGGDEETINQETPDSRLTDFILNWRRSQVVRQRSAKPPFSGSNPLAASKSPKADSQELVEKD